MENQSELVLNAGDALQLQFYPQTASDREERYYVRVIGYLASKSIIATAPVLDGKLMLLREGQQFTVRLISGNSVQAFMASLLKKTTAPYPYIHLSYPESLESKTIRKAQRINTRIIAAAQNLEPGKESIKTTSAVLNDLSSAGALIMSAQELGEIGDLISVSVKLTVAEVDEYLSVSAIIRRCLDKTDDEDQNRYGIEFQIADEREKLIIHGFVYEQLAKSMG